MAPENAFGARSTLQTKSGAKTIYRLDALGDLTSIPYSIKVLLEACLRTANGPVTQAHVEALRKYNARKVGEQEIPFNPARVVLQDFTGVPSMVDLAAMRAAMARMGGDPQKVNPLVPCDLVIDHSVQVDAFNSGMALQINEKYEFERNKERYEFLKWGQRAFDNFRVVPPATGIVHQVNLEYLGKVVWEKNGVIFPDSLVGTDSHTTMINGLGIVGWGVGGIEAEAVMLGQPIYMLIPEVIGFRMTGKLPEGSTATDLVLRVTEILRHKGVVGKFVEFYGPGLAEMPVATRATIANMAPEYGATIGFFPVDDQTLTYMRLTGRSEELISTVDVYMKEQGMWHEPNRKTVYTDEVSLDLGSIEPSLAGPRRPQDRIPLSGMKKQWHTDLSTTFSATHNQKGCVVLDPDTKEETEIGHGSVVIAAITSCTNTSNPSVMVGAGILARKAREKGLERKPWVKTSLAPGSKVVTEYLDKAGLTAPLEELGFYLVGYGCTTCIGNSGPLPEPVAEAVRQADLTVASVLSGNRNFEGRINSDVKANYLASPPLVVAYAIAGTVDIDLTHEPLGTDQSGAKVYLKDIWPSQEEISDTIAKFVSNDEFREQYANVFEGSGEWKGIKTSHSDLYAWDEHSTYIQEPPFFVDLTPQPQPIQPINGARCLVKVGDSVTTDHISPAGSIKASSPAGKYLVSLGVEPIMFNSYGSRRGNDRVMTRGTFANVRVRNELAPGTEGGFTRDFTDGEIKSIFDASLSYKELGTPLIVLAGKDYGMGSSRDWAAKGTLLLGVKAVIAESFERIHRSNLVGMGVMPLTYRESETTQSLGLDGTETFDVMLDDSLRPRDEVRVRATKANGNAIEFTAIARVDTPVEVDYYRNGGILQMVLRRMAKS
ncbi:MAG TPA: aconitate hydratase AcnA [Fimbriimonadales bacterium]|nr:aconitate hydratase AcnA [Fimbriimonadales bacterium]